MHRSYRPYIVAIGGTNRTRSSTERALQLILDQCGRLGAETRLFGGDFLMRLPMYDPSRTERTPEQLALVDAVRRADGLLIGTPGYHGGVSGAVKNALDLLEETSKDARPYLHDRAVGLVVAAYGNQAVGTTLGALRAIVHALRGWPTPLALALTSGDALFGEDGLPASQALAENIVAVASQVVEFARRRRAELVD